MKKNTLSVILPVMFGFLAMGFIDMIGLVTSNVRADFDMSDGLVNTISLSCYLWFLLLSIPVRGNGAIDDKERKVLADIKAWMDINSERICGTRRWKTFGEGPLAEAANPMNAQGFNEGQAYSSQDVR